MDEYLPTKNQFYCNTCHARFDKGRDAIAAHERTEKHKRAKAKATKDNLRQARNNNRNELNYEKEVQYLENRNKKLFKGEINNGVGVANKSSQPGSNQSRGAQGGGSGPVTAGNNQQKKGPQGNKKEPDPVFVPADLGAGFDKTNKKYFTAWKLIKDKDTGKLCFLNNISGSKFFDRPRGVKLTPEEEKIWEKYELNKDEIPPEAENDIKPEVHEAVIGAWEVVDPSEDFYNNNAVDPALESLESEEDPEEAILDEKIDNLEELDDEERENLLDLNKPEIGKSMLKAKSDKLRTLIESNFEVVSKPTFKKSSDILFKEPNLETEPPKKTKDGDASEQVETKTVSVFKKRQAKTTNKLLNDLHKDSDDE